MESNGTVTGSNDTKQPTLDIFGLFQEENIMENKFNTSTFKPEIEGLAFTLNGRFQQKPILVEIAKTFKSNKTNSRDVTDRNIKPFSDDFLSNEIDSDKDRFPEQERSSGAEILELGEEIEEKVER